MNLYIIFWCIIASIAAALPIPLIKEYTITKHWYWIVSALFSYILLIYAYSIVLSQRNIAVIYPFLKVLSVMLVVVAGIFMFRSNLNTKQWFGLLLGVSSIYLLTSK